jgi:probable F420-dependent oxidoreductase
MTKPFRFAVQSFFADSGDDWRAQVRQAEALGYSAFHLADHLIGDGPALAATNHPAQNLAAIPAMAVAAEASSTIRIGCRVFCCDYHNAVVLAKSVATLDFFSGGRIECGLGAGWLQGEYEAVGVPFKPARERIDRLEETIRVCRAHWADGLTDVTGTHVHAVGFEGIPKPVRTPGPPIMIGGGSRRVLGIAGREADIVSLNFDNSSGKIGPVGVGSSTAELTAQKIDWIRAGAGERFAEIEIEIGAYFTVPTPARDKTLGAMAPMFGLTPEQLGEHPHALIGSVDYLIETLQERRDRYGISYVTVGRQVAESFAPVVAALAGK